LNETYPINQSIFFSRSRPSKKPKEIHTSSGFWKIAALVDIRERPDYYKKFILSLQVVNYFHIFEKKKYHACTDLLFI